MLTMSKKWRDREEIMQKRDSYKKEKNYRGKKERKIKGRWKRSGEQRKKD